MAAVYELPREDREAHWRKLGYEDAVFETMHRYSDLVAFSDSEEGGKFILSALANHFPRNRTITFRRWMGGNIVAADNKGFSYVVVGSNHRGHYTPRTILRNARKGRRMDWEINGSPGVNALLLREFPETTRIPYPDAEAIIREYNEVIAHKSRTA